MKKNFLLFVASLLTLFCEAQELNYAPDELIVRLNFKLLNWDVVDNSEIKTLKIIDVLNDNGKAELSALGDLEFDFKNLEITKIFNNLKTSDSISIGRQGQIVYIPPFWATFKVEVPENINFYEFIDHLKKMYPLVIYCHPNFNVFSASVPNDSLYNHQFSLNNYSSFDHINLDSLWNFETGRNWIKVGVFDTGIDSTHEDIALLTGWDYDDYSYDQQWGTSSPNDHGLKVAGIIGARRNNGIGIAGIAGGNGNDTSGVRLIDFKRVNSNGEVTSIDLVSASVIDAARSVGSYYNWSDVSDDPHFLNTQGYGIQIGNHSYVYQIGDGNKDDSDSLSSGSGVATPGGYYPTCDLCRESFLFSLQNGVVSVVSRGNKLLDGSTSPYNYVGPELFPAAYDDSWVINVSASGNNGNRLVGGVNSPDSYFPPIGRNIDILAPGSSDNVFTTISLQNPNSVSNYGVFKGTSASAPHVSGVVALLLSYYNKNCYSNMNLDPADVEKILERSASATLENVTANGYSLESGYGRLNAYNAFKMIQYPNYQIVHPVDTFINQQVLSIDTITIRLESPLSVSYHGPLGSQFPLEPNRYYQVVKYEYQLTYNFSQFIQNSTDLIDVWIRHSETNSLGNLNDTLSVIETIMVGPNPVPTLVIHADTFRVEPYSEIQSFSVDSVILKGFYYHFINQHDLPNDINSTLIPLSYWYPINPNEQLAKMTYSIYIHDDSITSRYDFPCDSANYLIDSTLNVFTNEHNNEFCKIYPNPGNDYLKIANNANEEVNVRVCDSWGRTIKVFKIESNGNYIWQTNILDSGVYFVSFINSNGILNIEKWIKK